MAIALTIIVDNINEVIQIYDRIEVRRGEDPSVDPNLWTTTLSGMDPAGTGPAWLDLIGGTSYYRAYDRTGQPNIHWYASRYFSNSVSGSVSGWSEPVQGTTPDLFYDPCFPPELGNLSDLEKNVINEIRLLVGDPLDIRREYGEEASSSIHPDGKTYELDEKGWPLCITMGSRQYNDSTNPTINGYKYLIFDEFIDTTTVVCSGTRAYEYGVDIWYYTFRWSDRQIIEAYNRCPVPPGLNTINATSDAYVLYSSIRLLQSENWHDAIEDGATIRDEGTLYDPTPGFRFREALLKDLQKRLDDLVKTLMLRGITGVRVD